jgi:hypothetical protein
MRAIEVSLKITRQKPLLIDDKKVIFYFETKYVNA